MLLTIRIIPTVLDKVAGAELLDAVTMTVRNGSRCVLLDARRLEVMSIDGELLLFAVERLISKRGGALVVRGLPERLSGSCAWTTWRFRLWRVADFDDAQSQLEALFDVAA